MSPEVELRKKTLNLKFENNNNKPRKYNSGGGTPDLEYKLSLDPTEFNIESMGKAAHGTQANVDYAWIRTQSQHTIDIVRKKEKSPGDYSLNNELKKVSEH